MSGDDRELPDWERDLNDRLVDWVARGADKSDQPEEDDREHGR